MCSDSDYINLEIIHKSFCSHRYECVSKCSAKIIIQFNEIEIISGDIDSYIVFIWTISETGICKNDYVVFVNEL